MPMDLDKVGLTGEPVERSWTARDCMLYAISVGCGVDELQFATEKDQQVLPTMAVMLGGGAGLIYEAGSWKRGSLVHGEQGFTLEKPIPADGRARVQGKIAGIYDKGKGALVVLEGTARDPETDEVWFTTSMRLFIRGEGGFGGDRGPSLEANRAPDRKPDAEVRYLTLPEQALIYRMTGDMNPLHADPDFAKKAGFDQPILHGLCTYGFTGRALLHTLCGSDPGRFRSMDGRFSRPVVPGQELTVAMWVDGDEAIFQTKNSAGDVVIDQGRCGFVP
jgi:acyl dehydratase